MLASGSFLRCIVQLHDCRYQFAPAAGLTVGTGDAKWLRLNMIVMLN